MTMNEIRNMFDILKISFPVHYPGDHGHGQCIPSSDSGLPIVGWISSPFCIPCTNRSSQPTGASRVTGPPPGTAWIPYSVLI